MLGNFLKKIFGTKYERDLRRLLPIVDQINSLERETTLLSDRDLRAKTNQFKERLAKGETLEHLLPEAFAVAREASRRTLGLRPFDVQLMGGIVLHQGAIAEMKTGEGKTLVATLPVYLNALAGRGVHLVTVNDYLARRDAEWMGPIYDFLGVSVGIIQHGMNHDERKAAYNCDITYGTNNEMGFDYLRDNMVPDKEYKVQRGHAFAIVDEVDSILIDEARTPLIISGPAEESTDKYYKINRIIPRLTKGQDYEVEEKYKNVSMTEEGVSRAEALLGVGNLFEPENMTLVHHINQAIRAHELYKRDVEYVVKDGEVIIVDEFTGRLMPGRRWSEGLHQAVEAKEGLQIARENQTLATITLQNYFRMFEKLSGMTGTADTEAEEFMTVYKLDVVVIPTNKPMTRQDFSDQIYKSKKEKDEAIVAEIVERNEKGQPILVGTISIEYSEHLSRLLTRRGVQHHVLNAKYHEREAEIVARAGEAGAVTIATNMAGRGTDIKLGPGVVELGGLHIIGTERHESRRIDNQLRGRSGRQGDPGSTRFYLSCEDELVRLFGGDRMKRMMETLQFEEGETLEHPWISKMIEKAQTRVEQMNFDIRKHLVDYDEVMNKQREVIYGLRDELLEGDDPSELIMEDVEVVLEGLLDEHAPERGDWEMEKLSEQIRGYFGAPLLSDALHDGALDLEELRSSLTEGVKELYQDRMREFGEEVFKNLCRQVILRVLDHLWKDHLYALDSLRSGINLRAYGQKDPLVEYKAESFHMFAAMLDSRRQETVRYLFHLRPIQEEARPLRSAIQEEAMASRGGAGKFKNKKITDEKGKETTIGRKIGRNEPCPCGSGKKYKHCHGA